MLDTSRQFTCMVSKATAIAARRANSVNGFPAYSPPISKAPLMNGWYNSTSSSQIKPTRLSSVHRWMIYGDCLHLQACGSSTETDPAGTSPPASPFASYLDLEPVSVPTIVIHGTLDTIVPLEPVRKIALKIFTNITYHIVEDDHRLHKTTQEMDWKSILE